MEYESGPKRNRLEDARALVAALEADDRPGVDAALERLDIASSNALYSRVGEVARDMHEQIANTLAEPGMSRLAHDDAPDTRARLNRVIELTDDAAHRTMDAVERARPLAKAIRARAAQGEVGTSVADADAIDSLLEEILMAQDYQDLSGQLVRRAIALIEAIEWRLVDLLRHSGHTDSSGTQAQAPGTAHGFGPAVAGCTDGDVLNSQQQVDDLLADLGF